MKKTAKRQFARLADAMEEICRLSGKYGIFVSFMTPKDSKDRLHWREELNKAAPWLSDEFGDEMLDLLFDGSGFLIKDTKAEVDKLFELTIGDDGPIYQNKNKSEISVFALTCGPNGFRRENT